jgi:dGTPase
MLNWDQLLNPIRRKKLIDGASESLGTGVGRKELERDYDRILFATPTRRLADKTQVFPMEEHDSIRTRLTHSHEVSNLARSIGIRLAFEHAEEVFGKHHDQLEVKRNIPPLLAAVGLAHDLGNPPFGHQGELAIQQWFQEKNKKDGSIQDDFLQFDGNAQTLRLLTRLQVLNDQYGLNLTVATLAALIKYPTIYGTSEMFGLKKHGIFQSETEIAQQVWEQTGLGVGIRHPLVFIMEACDDIAYSIIDAEDTVKKGYASFYDLMDHLESTNGNDPITQAVLKTSWNENGKFKSLASSKTHKISSRELNDASMQMFRVKAISEMVVCATEVFVQNIQKIMNGDIERGFELIKNSKCTALCSATKKFDYHHGFQHREVLRLELKGNNYIKSMMTMLWNAIQNEDSPDNPFARYVYGNISENYKVVYNNTNKDDYAKRQLLCDAISGMTETYLIKRHNEYQALEHA